ncbi:hypothetical protein MMC07_005889 [Pseudocyphellaria aurata]|nr:hypothetical protein [Pseudocyphellaria aurata]
MPSQTLLRQVLFILDLCALTVVAQSPTQTALASSWPTGTNAQASTVHSRMIDGTTFYASNAIDGNLTTKWNDDTLGGYPDILTVSIPIDVTLTGIIIISGEDGWLSEYTVETSGLTNDSGWTTPAQIHNATSPIQLINFLTPVIARQVRISVQLAGDYSRIHEVYPLFGTSSSSASSSSASASSASSSSASSSASNSTADQPAPEKCSNAGTIAAGVIGGMLFIILAVLAGAFLSNKRGNRDGRVGPEPKFELYPQEIGLGNPQPGLNTLEPAGPAGHIENTAYPATAPRLNHLANSSPRTVGFNGFNGVRQVHEKPADAPNRTSHEMETTSTIRP